MTFRARRGVVTTPCLAPDQPTRRVHLRVCRGAVHIGHASSLHTGATDRHEGATVSSVVVTGASSGIGEAIARRFVADGWDVVTGSRSEPNLDGAECGAPMSQTLSRPMRSLPRPSSNSASSMWWSTTQAYRSRRPSPTPPTMSSLTSSTPTCGRVQRVPGGRASDDGPNDGPRSQASNPAAKPAGPVAASSSTSPRSLQPTPTPAWLSTTLRKGPSRPSTRSIAVDHGHQGIRCVAVSPGLDRHGARRRRVRSRSGP